MVYQQEKQFKDAIENFSAGDIKNALCSFIDLYQGGYRKEQIMQILDEACYLPNEVEMRENYEKNISALKDYPFVMGGPICAFEELSFRLYMIGNSEFAVFDRSVEQFTERFQSDDQTQFDLYSAPVNGPLFLENETNASHLTFLNNIIRKSEDIACDNHIYLFYDSFQELAKLLLAIRIDPLLADKKFVFLFGAENRSYPLDFQGLFGINYADLPCRDPSVGEIKRIIFGWKIANLSGTSFLADVMDFHPDLLTIPDCIMYSFADLYMGQLRGKSLAEAVSYLKSLPDSDGRKAGIMSLVHNGSETLSEALRAEFNRVSAEQFLTVLESVLSDFPHPSAKEWLAGIFLAYSRCHGRTFGRLIPALFLYPHDDMFYLAGVARDTAQFYFDLVESFPYHKVIASIRNPVTQAGSVINYMTHGHQNARNARGEVQLDPFYALMFGAILPKDYYFPLNHPLWKDIRVVRFEDLKLNPEATFTSMSEFLNIHVTGSMYHTTWCGLERAGVNSENAVFDGFDPTPVYKSYAQYLSVFDKYRIELLLQKRIEAYGYQTKYYDGQQFSDEEIIAMMGLPFKCETIETIVPKQQRQHGRSTGMQFIRFAIAIKGFPFSVNGSKEEFTPLPWLRPKEELLREPLYR